MKRTLLFFLMLGLTVPIYAQRYDESANINLSVGYVKKGYDISAGYEKFFSRNDAISFDLGYAGRKENLRTVTETAKFSDYTITASYRRYFNFPKIFPYVGLGLFAGYQNFNNKSNFSPSILIERESGALYGLHPEVGVEFNFKAMSLNIACAPRYEFHFKDFLPVIKLGIKYYF